jgi:hypothetical protein
VVTTRHVSVIAVTLTRDPARVDLSSPGAVWQILLTTSYHAMTVKDKHTFDNVIFGHLPQDVLS